MAGACPLAGWDAAWPHNRAAGREPGDRAHWRRTWNAPFAFTPVAIAFAVVGAPVAARTGNNLGWLLLGTGVAAAVVLVTRAYAARVPAAELPAAAWVGWTFTLVLWISAPLLVLPLLVFPDGRLPSPRWRPVVWVVIIDALALMVCPALSDVNFSSNFPRLRDPVMVVAPLGDGLQPG